MKYIYLSLLITFNANAQRLARVSEGGQVLEILQSEGIEKKFHADFIRDLVQVSEDVNQNDFVFEGQKIIRPDSKAKLNKDGEWEYSQEDLKREQNDALDQAIVIELKAFAEKTTVTNKEAQRAVKLILKKLGLIEKSAE